MRIATPATRRPARVIAAALLLSAATGLAWAAPDEPADAITGLVDRADDARVHARRAARRGLTTASDDAEVASDEADML